MDAKNLYTVQCALLADLLNVPQTENALWKSLSPENLKQLVTAVFDNHSKQAQKYALCCIEDGKLDTVGDFLVDHHNLVEKFNLGENSKYFCDLTRIITRERQRVVGQNPNDTLCDLRILVPSMPNPPSGPPTPSSSVMEWVNNLQPASHHLIATEPELSPRQLVHSCGTDTRTRPITKKRLAKTLPKHQLMKLRSGKILRNPPRQSTPASARRMSNRIAKRQSHTDDRTVCKQKKVS